MQLPQAQSTTHKKGVERRLGRLPADLQLSKLRRQKRCLSLLLLQALPHLPLRFCVPLLPCNQRTVRSHNNRQICMETARHHRNRCTKPDAATDSMGLQVNCFLPTSGTSSEHLHTLQDCPVSNSALLLQLAPPGGAAAPLRPPPPPAARRAARRPAPPQPPPRTAELPPARHAGRRLHRTRRRLPPAPAAARPVMFTIRCTHPVNESLQSCWHVREHVIAGQPGAQIAANQTTPSVVECSVQSCSEVFKSWLSPSARRAAVRGPSGPPAPRPRHRLRAAWQPPRGPPRLSTAPAGRAAAAPAAPLVPVHREQEQ